MAVKGIEAKGIVTQKLKEAFGNDFIGEIGGKVYVKAMDNGQKIQVAISMTCPKELATNQKDGGAFSLSGDVSEPVKIESEKRPAEVTSEETENIKKLLAELGL